MLAELPAPYVPNGTQLSPFEVLDVQAVKPNDLHYLVIDNQHLTTGPDAGHVLSETRIVTQSKHPIKEADFLILLAEYTVPRNTVRSTICKELLTTDRYSDALHRMRLDPCATVLWNTIPAMKSHDGKEYVKLILAMNAARYVTNGIPLMKGPVGAEVKCTCCSTNTTAHQDDEARIIYGVGPATQCQFKITTGHRIDICLESACNVKLVMSDNMVL